jgi:hypothetical protein
MMTLFVLLKGAVNVSIVIKVGIIIQGGHVVAQNLLTEWHLSLAFRLKNDSLLHEWQDLLTMI